MPNLMSLIMSHSFGPAGGFGLHDVSLLVWVHHSNDHRDTPVPDGNSEACGALLAMIVSRFGRRAFLAGATVLGGARIVRGQTQAYSSAFRLESGELRPSGSGVAATPTARLRHFPRWTEDSPISVAEVAQDGTIKPYPTLPWNSWRNAEAAKMSPGERFVCVQSVVADGQGNLWVLDAASPGNERVIAGAPSWCASSLPPTQWPDHQVRRGRGTAGQLPQ